MATIREINDKIEEGKSLKMVTQAFTDIASTKLKRIRAKVEKNRIFFDDLTNIYKLVNQLAAAGRVKAKVKNGKTITILITSNYRFYGKITNDLINFYLAKTGNINVDRIIVGKTAKSYLDAIHFAKPYNLQIFKDDLPDGAELKILTDIIKDYSQVLVFHSEFKSVIIQVPVIKDVTQSVSEINVKDKSELKTLKVTLNYILEPQIKTILEFFDAQIKNLLLDQTFLESELARTGSRLMTMDNAQNEANNYLKSEKYELSAAKKSVLNAKILETFTSLQIARKEANSV